MTSSIDWVHEIDTSLDGIDQPPAAYVAAFSDYVAARGPHVRRLAHAICCDWTRAEALVLETLSLLDEAWHRIDGGIDADAFVNRVLARAVVTDSPTPRSLNAHGEDFPIEDESLLFDGLQSLTAMQRKALVLHDWLDLPVEEVAEALEISPELVVRHATRGRSALNVLLPQSA